MKIRALDIGFGNVKYTTGILDGKLQYSLFPSYAPQATRSPDLSEHGRRKNTVIAQINGASFEVGKDSHAARDASYAPTLDPDYPMTDGYLALMRGALYYMDTPEIDVLVLGLPVNTFIKYRAALKQRAVGVHSIQSGRQGESTKIVVKDATVLAQPLGAMLDYSMTNGVLAQFSKQINLVIDPGYFTLDWLITDRGVNNFSRSGAHPGGMSAILKALADGIGRKLDSAITDISKIDRALMAGENPQFFGKECDLAEHLPAACSKAREFVSVLANTIGNASDIDNIILAGGGASFFREAIQEKFPNHQLLDASDPVFANVRGFHLGGIEYSKAKETMAHRAHTA